jgi:hypothetical protein
MYNRFVPTGLRTRNAYGWAASPRYNLLDVPGWSGANNERRRNWLEQQFSYEWYDWSAPERHLSNPPFRSGAAGVLLPSLTSGPNVGGLPARILRGFIRRAEFEVGNRISYARLYFMYNPEVIIRDYVSYLDQGALDPFNSVFESGNLVAPPSFLDFSFELFFDRQVEAQARDNPGVFVDYEFFDMVVRNVVPRTRSQNNAIPDSGVMMVNPRDITVVFSPQITVQGRPLNARIAFEKFTHRMVPTRMRIALTMRVIYFGPERDMVQYEADEFVASQTIPYRKIKPAHFEFTYNKLQVEATLTEDEREDRDNQWEDTTEANKKARREVLQYVKDHSGSTQYKVSRRKDIWTYADAASLVWGGYKDLGYALGVGWNESEPPTVATMTKGWMREGGGMDLVPGSDHPTPFANRSKGNVWKLTGDSLGRMDMLRRFVTEGDLLIRKGSELGPDHVAFVESVDIEFSSGVGHVKVYHISAQDPTARSEEFDTASHFLNSLTHFARAQPIGNTVGGVPTPPAELQAKIDRIADRTEDPFLVWIDRGEFDLVSSAPGMGATSSPDGVVPGVVHPRPGTGGGEYPQLQIDAAYSLRRIVEKIGQKMPLVGDRRTWDYQDQVNADPSKPSSVGGGQGYHVVGLAIDCGAVSTYRDALHDEGWIDYDPSGDAPHFAYLRRG